MQRFAQALRRWTEPVRTPSMGHHRSCGGYAAARGRGSDGSPSRNSLDDDVVGDILDHAGTGADDGPGPDRKVLKHRRVRPHHGFRANDDPSRDRHQRVDRHVVLERGVVTDRRVEVQMNVTTQTDVGGDPDARADDRALADANIVPQRRSGVHEGGSDESGGGEAFIDDTPDPACAYADDELDLLRSGHHPVGPSEDSRAAGLNARQIDLFRVIIDVAQEVPGRRQLVDGIHDVVDLPAEAAAADNDKLRAHGVSWSVLVPRNSGIVASPAALIPSRRTTDRTVASRILRSPRREWWSTYSTSNRNLSSQPTALRPETCARPVSPGRTSCRRACSG